MKVKNKIPYRELTEVDSTLIINAWNATHRDGEINCHEFSSAMQLILDKRYDEASKEIHKLS